MTHPPLLPLLRTTHHSAWTALHSSNLGNSLLLFNRCLHLLQKLESTSSLPRAWLYLTRMNIYKGLAFSNLYLRRHMICYISMQSFQELFEKLVDAYHELQQTATATPDQDANIIKQWADAELENTWLDLLFVKICLTGYLFSIDETIPLFKLALRVINNDENGARSQSPSSYTDPRYQKIMVMKSIIIPIMSYCTPSSFLVRYDTLPDALRREYDNGVVRCLALERFMEPDDVFMYLT